MDRNRNKIIDIVVSKSRSKAVFVRMAQRLESRVYKVRLLCTDGYEGYSSYRLDETHIISKADFSCGKQKLPNATLLSQI